MGSPSLSSLTELAGYTGDWVHFGVAKFHVSFELIPFLVFINANCSQHSCCYLCYFYDFFLFFLLFQIFYPQFLFLKYSTSSYSCHPFGTVLMLIQVYACFKYFELVYLAFSSVFYLEINRYEFLLCHWYYFGGNLLLSYVIGAFEYVYLYLSE